MPLHVAKPLIGVARVHAPLGTTWIAVMPPHVAKPLMGVARVHAPLGTTWIAVMPPHVAKPPMGVVRVAVKDPATTWSAENAQAGTAVI
jgi:hypothetical protein